MGNEILSKSEILRDSYKLTTIYLNPGDIYFTVKKELVFTVLGSCISMIFFHPESGFFAMNHVQYPFEKDSKKSCIEDSNEKKYVGAVGKYFVNNVIGSFNIMYNSFIQKGINPYQIIVKLFGGADILRLSHNSFSIGANNVEIALKMINSKNLKISKSDVRGNVTRELYTYSDSGTVYMTKFRGS